VKYPDKLILFAKEETAIKGMTDNLFVNERYQGMEMNLEK
jgi:hypothetical protein